MFTNEQKKVPEKFTGPLRPVIIPIGDRKYCVQWRDERNNEVIWTETCNLPIDKIGFSSQILCDGEFTPISPYMIDAEQKRHHVLKAEGGIFGSSLGNRQQLNNGSK